MSDKSPRPLDGGDTAPLGTYMVNAPAGSMSKSEPKDTLLEDEVISVESDGYHGGRLDNLPPEKPKSLSETRKAVMAEYKEARIRNEAEAEAMLNKPGVTIAELEELEHRHTAEYMRCYMKIRAVNDESTARLLEIRGEAADLLKRVYAGEEVSGDGEDQVWCLERMLELCQ